MSSTGFDNVLVTRYASPEMSRLWSAQTRYGLWRRLWHSLARHEMDLGLPITPGQVAELAEHLDDIDFEKVAGYEKKLRHDVMAHVHAFGDVAPTARPIIHLGATSCFVTDNGDLVQLRDALRLVRDGLVGVIDALARFADAWKKQPCLGYTHYQPAQLVTVGKRATLWCQDLLMDLTEVERRIADLKFLGVKGTTGTQASFLALFNNDHGRAIELEKRVAGDFGFSEVIPVSGQTYTRKIDSQILATLAQIGETAHKFGSDMRLLSHDRELDEPFEAGQIGSSAMAYKKNPMRSERLCSLARFVMAQPQAGAQTAATQWLERTLDDSAVRRLILPQAFLATDAMIKIYLNVVPGLVVNTAIIDRNVRRELPFMATENLMMAAVKAGADRQDVHEVIREQSMAAIKAYKSGESAEIDLLERLKSTETFGRVDLESAMNAADYIGRSAEQVDEFIAGQVEPVRQRYPQLLGQQAQLHV
ncbi:MAG: adenylosuccinate lyase [Isosphaeraceae bacterium]